MINRLPGRLRLDHAEVFLPQVIADHELIVDPSINVGARTRPDGELKIERNLRRIMQQVERLSLQEMHARSRKLEPVVAPREDKLLREHRERKAREKRN